MSLTRRLAAGMPAAGVTLLAALALAGSPAAATGEESAARAQQPAVMTTPCSDADRGDKCDYGNGNETPDNYATPTDTGAPQDDNVATPDDTGAPQDDNGAGPTRGNPGYSAGPATVPPSTPSTGDVNTPPGTSPATTPSTPGGGVSAGGTLPLTGAPMGLTVALGGLMIAGGAAAVYFTRRRRSA